MSSCLAYRTSRMRPAFRRRNHSGKRMSRSIEFRCPSWEDRNEAYPRELACLHPPTRPRRPGSSTVPCRSQRTAALFCASSIRVWRRFAMHGPLQPDPHRQTEPSPAHPDRTSAALDHCSLPRSAYEVKRRVSNHSPACSSIVQTSLRCLSRLSWRAKTPTSVLFESRSDCSPIEPPHEILPV